MKRAKKLLTRTHRFIQKFLHDTEKKTLSPLFAIGFALLIGTITTTSVVLLLPLRIDISLELLIFLLPITLVSWYSGMISASMTALFISIGVIFFAVFPSRNILLFPLSSWISLFIFLSESVLISILLQLAKRRDLLMRFMKREKAHMDMLTKMKAQETRIKEEIKARDEFLSMVSHELKTPLTSMLLQAQMAVHNIKNVSLANFSIEKLLKTLENSEEQIKQLSKMVSDLMNVSLITTGKLELQYETVDVLKITKTVIDRLLQKAEKEETPILLSSDEPVEARIDILRFEQVLTNLLTNAIKYGNKKPVEIHVFKENSWAVVTVKDHGIGLSPEKQKRLFARFERGDNAKSYEGLGVGLYIAHQIIKAHKGKIRVESKKNKGTLFRVEIPS